jgi:hypothetical protein
MRILWGYRGDIKGISWGYHGYKVVLEQSDVLPLKVELKLGHWRLA